MTDDEWSKVEQEIIGLWGTSNRELTNRRLAIWRKRFRQQPYAVMRAAIEQLEKICDHWPGIARLRAALYAATPAPVSAQQNDHRPLTMAEWAERAEFLELAATRSKHNGDYLRTLAGFYMANAIRVADGAPPEWPPPPASGAFAALRHVVSTESTSKKA